MEVANVHAGILRIAVTTLFLIALGSAPAMSQKQHDPRGSDTEIKIGNIMPYSGAFAEYGAIGRAEAAYFQMLNDRVCRRFSNG